MKHLMLAGNSTRMIVRRRMSAGVLVRLMEQCRLKKDLDEFAARPRCRRSLALKGSSNRVGCLGQRQDQETTYCPLP